MRPPDNELIDAYMADLRIEIECNAREAAAGRTDLAEYDAKCRAELAWLEHALRDGVPVGVDRYGIPSAKAAAAAQLEALQLILAVARAGQ